MDELKLHVAHMDRFKPQSAQEQDIRNVCDSVKELLVKKNRNYGASAFRVPMLCPDCRQADVLIRARASDKIERLVTLLSGKPDEVGESLRDTVQDLAGYLVLWLVEMKHNSSTDEE